MRKPKPTHLKILQGNPGKRRLNRNEPQPQGNLRDAPDWLSDSQKVGWDIAIASAPDGLLKQLDGPLLAIWVVAEDLHRQACEQVKRAGLIIRSPVKNEPMQNPYLPIINKQAQIMMKAASELGFTPSSRTRIQVFDDGKANKFQKFDRS